MQKEKPRNHRQDPDQQWNKDINNTNSKKKLKRIMNNTD